MPAAARVTGTVFIVCIVLAAVIAGAGGLISWATGMIISISLM